MNEIDEDKLVHMTLRQRGEYRFECRLDAKWKEYVWYIKRTRGLSSSQIEALRDPTGLESVNGEGWKADIDIVIPERGTLCCTTENSHALMIKRMDEIYRILKDNE